MQLNLETVQQLQDMAKRSDHGLFVQLVNHYIDDCVRIIASIERAIEAQDLPAVRQAAQGLHTASRAMGTQRMELLCEQLEYLEAFLSTEEMHTLVRALRAEYKDACQTLFKLNSDNKLFNQG